MSNELELALSNASPAQINKLFGITDNKPKPVIPILKVNAEEGEGFAPKGNFTYDDGDRVLYAPEIVFRTFIKGYQYRLFDKDDPSKNDVSVIRMDFKKEYRSTSGRIACGKMSKKKFAEIEETASAQQQYFQKNAKCKLLIFGLVSGEFTDLDTKTKVILEDAPFVWGVSQSGFMSVDSAITGIGKERRAVPLTPIQVHTKKEKVGTNTFYVPVPRVMDQTVELDIKRDAEYLGVFTKYIKDTNAYVDAKYDAALNGKAMDNSFAEVALPKGADPLDDMNDDTLPF